MRATDLQSRRAPLTRRPYETPTIADLGSVAAVTASLAKNTSKDGGNNKIKT